MPANQDQQLYQQIINTVLDAVINMDDQGIIIEWNKSAEEIFGWKKEEVIGKLLSEIIIPPQFREAHKRGLERYRLSGEGPVLNKRIEITALSREGKEFPIELAITPVKLGDKLIFNGFIRDITERKKSREQFQQVVESAPNAMVMVDETGKIQMVNKATETLFGYAREELLEMNVDKLVPKRFQGNHHEHRRRFHSDLKVRAMGAGRDLYGLKKDGSEVPIEIGLNPIKTDRGVFVLASIIDIHERKELEKRSKEFAQQLEKEVAERTQALLRQRAAALNIMEDERQAKKRLEKAEQDLQKQAEALSRSNKDLEQFAYVASHDLQEPIRKVVGFSQLFAKEFEGKMDKNSQEYMNYIVDGAKRMQILIQDLLQFSKVSSGKLIVEPTDLNEVAAEAMQNLESVIQENKADIRLDRLPVISVHRVQIVQLFQNLIGNAIKYRGSKDPEIRITAQKQNDLWAFSIKDNGIGIAPEFFEKIFVIFQRLHGKNSKYPGTGIGLAICKRTVERHGGRIWVESAPGEGTTFKFTLPERG